MPYFYNGNVTQNRNPTSWLRCKSSATVSLS